MIQLDWQSSSELVMDWHGMKRSFGHVAGQKTIPAWVVCLLFVSFGTPSDIFRCGLFRSWSLLCLPEPFCCRAIHARSCHQMQVQFSESVRFIDCFFILIWMILMIFKWMLSAIKCNELIEWMNEWMSELVNEWMSEWMKRMKCMKWMKWMKE